MPRVFIGVGSNIEPEDNVRKALGLLQDYVDVKTVSTFYCTEPEGRSEQPPFYNGIFEIDTDLPPVDLKRSVLGVIEEKLGRVRTEDKYAPRTIDLDVLIYNDIVITAEEITVPDPQIAKRPFLAVPLYELAPDLILPDSGAALKDIAEGFENHDMKPLIQYTELLRKDLVDGLREGRAAR